jgi:hypothetical protein
VKRRRTLFALAFAALVGLSVLIGYFLSVGRPPETIALTDEEVESVIAELFKVDDIPPPVPPTKVPREYVPKILNALRPILVHQYPHQWDEWTTLGKVTINKRDGTKVEILFPMCGQNPLCYKYNGVRCMRGGQYEPVMDLTEGGVRFGYGDESLMFANVIREIHREVTKSKKSEMLTDMFHDLERSAGKRPPR